MRCPRCGADLAPGAARCTGCGESSRPAVASGVLTPPPPYTGDAATTFSPDLVNGGLTTLSTGDAGETSTQAPGVAAAPAGATGPLEAGQTFGTRYHIIRALGVGGM